MTTLATAIVGFSINIVFDGVKLWLDNRKKKQISKPK